MKTDSELLKLAEENLKWFIDNSSKIREQFGGKVIAIYDKKIIASADNSMKLREKLKNRGVDDTEIIIERIPMKGETKIFL